MVLYTGIAEGLPLTFIDQLEECSEVLRLKRTAFFM